MKMIWNQPAPDVEAAQLRMRLSAMAEQMQEMQAEYRHACEMLAGEVTRLTETVDALVARNPGMREQLAYTSVHEDSTPWERGEK